ncbi:MAG: 2-dehydropantoate 2-reductase [Chromatiales bacterium]|jgi:2-dehydropantoate 2-reductase|nr:2-dehydropantoate 2-reductase [Chromatiales bacterium]
MRIAIYGSGGLGGYYGVRLAQAGHDVVFIARGEHLAAIRANGLKVISPLGDALIEAPTATDDPTTVPPVDAVLVAVKTWQVEAVAHAMKPMLKSDTVVVPFLNGVESGNVLDAVLGAGHAAGGLSKIFSLIEAPGVIRHFNDAAFVSIGELDDSKSTRMETLRAAFEGAGVDVEISEDINRALWEKLLMVTSWAGMGALARSPIGDLRADPETRQMIDQSMDESIAVANAHGIAINTSLKKVLWSFYDAMPGGATASLIRDMMEGKPSELDAWNGAIHRIGQIHGVPTPTHSFVYQLLRPMERRAREAHP